MVYTRKNQARLTSTEKRRFVNALLELKRKGQYDEFVRTHIEHYVSDGESGLRVAHMTPSFLPWHRRFLLEFERALQRVDSSVSVPYWDWTVDRKPSSSLWGSGLMGGNGRRSDRQVMTGPFARRNGHWTIKEGATAGDFLMRDFGRPDNPIALPTKAELARAMRDPVYDTPPWDSTSAKGYRNKLEGWTSRSGNAKWRNHNRVHRWVGGHMLGGASVNDPVFWLNHAFVDLLWDRWRARHPRSAPYLPAEPTGADNGPLHGHVAARHEAMPPWGVTPDELLSHRGIYRYG
ncbi:tyrosinase [Streptomyces longisporoflavus]|uniref:tyrosinase family protein n=1 Tax=Streptomyces longisporoflavus TaxID=28044 RepID=UPI00167E06D4|nr:tyrosinase family protein [Streptomyces longisporoflavus]GGV69484.1 tyrosinase [Streptomyces longisporoflavus]